MKIGTFTGVLLIGFWQGWEFPLSPFTLLLFALYSFAQIVTVSKSLMSLFKKSNYVQIALFFPCTSQKTKVSDLLFFTSKLPFHSQTFIFFVCFWHFLTVFHFIMPKSKSLPLLITKEWPSLFTREWWEPFTLFHKWIKDAGRLLSLLYRYIFFACLSPPVSHLPSHVPSLLSHVSRAVLYSQCCRFNSNNLTVL